MGYEDGSGAASAAARSDAYVHVDVENARRFAAIGWCATAAIAAAFLPFYPPTEALGSAGWALGIVCIVVIAVPSVLMLRRGSGGGLAILMTSYAGAILIGVLQWLGGVEAPYRQLLLFVVVAGVLVQPPRRFAGLMAATALIRFAPIVYAPEGFRTGDALMQMVLWAALAGFLYGLMEQLRSQRILLRRSGELAEHKALSDELTRLGNRRAFDQDLRYETERSRRSGDALSLIVFDLDDFKGINDRYGHAAGDDALVAVGEAIRAKTRAIDGCYRWGGDEFCALLPGTPAPGAKILATRIAAATDTSISWGIAEFGPDMTAQRFVESADAELLRTKRQRKAAFARVVTADA